MAIPLVMYGQAASQALPVVAALVAWGRREPVPRPRVVAWCLVLVATDLMSLVVARLEGNNLWLNYFTTPTEVGLVLWLLSEMQVTEFLRIAYGLAIPIMGTVVVALLLLTDPAVTFARWAAPFLGLLGLGASLFTLVHRTISTRQPLTEQDWFWISLGLSLFWTGYVSVPVFADTFLSSHIEWVRWAYIGRAWTDIAAFLLISWGMVCQWVPARLHGSS